MMDDNGNFRYTMAGVKDNEDKDKELHGGHERHRIEVKSKTVDT